MCGRRYGGYYGSRYGYGPEYGYGSGYGHGLGYGYGSSPNSYGFGGYLFISNSFNYLINSLLYLNLK